MLNVEIGRLQETLVGYRKRLFRRRSQVVNRLGLARYILGEGYSLSNNWLFGLVATFENGNQPSALRRCLEQGGRDVDYFRIYVRNLDLSPEELEDVYSRVQRIKPGFSWTLEGVAAECHHDQGLRRHLNYLDGLIKDTEDESRKSLFIGMRNHFLLGFPEVTD